jgi:hypothetical protein
MDRGSVVSLGAKGVPLPGRRGCLWLEPQRLRMSELRAQDKKQQQS